jgi:hypothetical protein
MPAVGFQIDDPAQGIDESQTGEGLREVAQALPLDAPIVSA